VEVTASIEVPATLAQPADVEEPAIAKRVTSPPTAIVKAEHPREEEAAVRVASSSRPGPASRERTVTPVSPALASLSGEAPRPVSPIQPPTDTASGPRLALYRPEATPASPAVREKPSRIEYTPLAMAGESIYANLEPVAENRLDAATEGVNERVAMNASYSKRPELEIMH